MASFMLCGDGDRASRGDSGGVCFMMINDLFLTILSNKHDILYC